MVIFFSEKTLISKKKFKFKWVVNTEWVVLAPLKCYYHVGQSQPLSIR